MLKVPVAQVLQRMSQELVRQRCARINRIEGAFDGQGQDIAQLHQKKSILVHSGVSTEDRTGDRTVAPFSGKQIFHTSAQLRAQQRLFRVVRDALEALANEVILNLVFDKAGIGDPCTYRARGDC